VDSTAQFSEGLLQPSDREKTLIVPLVFPFSLPYCSDYTYAQNSLTGGTNTSAERHGEKAQSLTPDLPPLSPPWLHVTWRSCNQIPCLCLP